MSACIVGVGEPLAGDDAAGWEVVQRLEALPALGGVELFRLRDPSELATLLPGHARALVVDARLEPGRPGHVELFEEPFGAVLDVRGRPLSSHGVDALTAIELGRILAGARGFPRLSLLTIAIAPPERLGSGLSEAVRHGVGLAVERAQAWARGAADA